MKLAIKLEELAQFLAGVFILIFVFRFPFLEFLVFLFLPDLSMLAYIFGPKIGALIYNIVHHKGVAILIALLGMTITLQNGYAQSTTLLFVGVFMYLHSCWDRFFGYGLKYSDSFSNTHLGKIGK